MHVHTRVELVLPEWLSALVATVQAPLTDARAQVGLAIELSRRNVEAGTGGPFGAALFDADGVLLGVGVNRVVPQQCSVAHAEMMAFMTTQQRLGSFRLNSEQRKVTLATSSQPCAMCYGASIWAGIDRMLIGARAADVEALTEFDEGPLPSDWQGALRARGIELELDVEREAACKVLADYSNTGGRRY